MGRPRRAWVVRFTTSRPSSGSEPGPYVLKIRTTRASSPRFRTNAIVNASPNRLATSYIDRGPVLLTLPILFGLRMLERIPIGLGGARIQEVGGVRFR